MWKIGNTLLLLLLATAGASCAVAQTHKPAHDLELNLEARDVRNGIPTTFHVILRNNSDHEIRLPEPSLGCASALDGTVWLVEHVTPRPPGNEPALGYGCTADRTHSADILERARGWVLLRSGGYLERTASPSRMHYESHGAGTYELSAEYVPPQVTAQERRLLAHAGIVYPQAKLTSSHLKLIKTR